MAPDQRVVIVCFLHIGGALEIVDLFAQLSDDVVELGVLLLEIVTVCIEFPDFALHHFRL